MMRFREDFLTWYAENEDVLEEVLQTGESLSCMREFLEKYPALTQMYWNHLWTSGEAQNLLPRRAGELIFCFVRFSPEGKEYCYLADEDIYREGDAVMVPAGEDNHAAAAVISSILYRTAENAPLPAARLKSILGKYDKGET